MTVKDMMWIKRRARRLQNFYKVSRLLAIHDAYVEWIGFIGAGGIGGGVRS